MVSVADGLARDEVKRKGWGGVANGVIDADVFQAALRERGRSLVADFVRDVQVDPAAVFDLRSVVVEGLTSDPRALVNLFERCGERDLRFVVNSGLVLGGLLGVGQMLLWIAWSPWWSLALTGALVGWSRTNSLSNSSLNRSTPEDRPFRAAGPDYKAATVRATTSLRIKPAKSLQAPCCAIGHDTDYLSPCA